MPKTPPSLYEPRNVRVGYSIKDSANMISEILIALIVAFVLFEIIEHVVFPLIWLILRRKRGSISGAEGMVGKVVHVRQWDKTEGQVSVNSDLCRAVSDVPLSKGDKAVIHNVEGLTLRVEPFKD